LSVQKKGDIYYVVLPYRDAKNKKKYKWIRVGPSIREAEKMERQIRTDIERGEIVLSDKTTLGNFLVEWMDTSIRPNRRPSTISNYDYHVTRITDGIGNIEITKLTTHRIQKHVNAEKERTVDPKRVENPKRKRSKKDIEKLKPVRKVSPTTVIAQFNVLKEAMDKAVQWGLISKNPCDGVDLPEREQKPHIVYKPHQTEALIKFAQNTKFKIPILLGFLCGLRRGEICGLRLYDIDTKEQGAYIRHSLDRMKVDDAKKLEEEKKVTVFWDTIKKPDAKTVLVLGPVKTDESEGFIPLPDIVMAAIEEVERQEKRNKLKFGEAYKKHGFVWAWEDGSPHDPDYLYHQIQRLIEKYNVDKKEEDKLPRLHPHAMRHSHATFLLRNKVDNKLVSKQLRHKRASFTSDLYQHVQKDMQRETASVMDNMFGENPTAQKDAK